MARKKIRTRVKAKTWLAPRKISDWHKKNDVFTDVTANTVSDGVNELLAKYPEVKPTSRKLASIIRAAWKDTLDQSAVAVANELERKQARFIREMSTLNARFQSTLYSRWQVPLDKLQVLYHASLEHGSKFFTDNHLPPFDPQDPLLSALAQLHARGSRVTAEILCLLRGGFPEGAHARWRTLHEVVVVATVLAKCDVALSEAYLLHEHVQMYRAALQYDKHYKRLRMRKLPKRVLTKLRDTHDTLIQRYGKSFATDYGWSCGAISSSKPTFTDLEQFVEMDGYRPIYRWASERVHAGARGLRPIDIDELEPHSLLGGPTDMGLADPGIHTADTILKMAEVLETARPSLDNQMMVETLHVLAQRCSDAFVQVDQG